MTESKLKAIEERAEKATPAPWQHGFDDGSGRVTKDADWPQGAYIVRGDDTIVTGGNFEGIACGVEELADADFIAHARQDVPALIAEVRRLREVLHSIATECPHHDTCSAMASTTASKVNYALCDCHVADARAALEGK